MTQEPHEHQEASKPSIEEGEVEAGEPSEGKPQSSLLPPMITSHSSQPAGRRSGQSPDNAAEASDVPQESFQNGPSVEASTVPLGVPPPRADTADRPSPKRARTRSAERKHAGQKHDSPRTKKPGGASAEQPPPPQPSEAAAVDNPPQKRTTSATREHAGDKAHSSHSQGAQSRRQSSTSGNKRDSPSTNDHGGAPSAEYMDSFDAFAQNHEEGAPEPSALVPTGASSSQLKENARADTKFPFYNVFLRKPQTSSNEGTDGNMPAEWKNNFRNSHDLQNEIRNLVDAIERKNAQIKDKYEDIATTDLSIKKTNQIKRHVKRTDEMYGQLARDLAQDKETKSGLKVKLHTLQSQKERLKTHLSNLRVHLMDHVEHLNYETQKAKAHVDHETKLTDLKARLHRQRKKSHDKYLKKIQGGLPQTPAPIPTPLPTAE